MRLLAIAFCLLTCEVAAPSLPEIIIEPRTHHFLGVYERIRASEGNYVYHPHDKGGETYGGISRRNHPKWYGWRYIDAAKPLRRHDSVASAELWVKDWYLTRWVRGDFEKIKDQDLALNLFDFSIHSSPRTVQIKVNRVLAKYGCDPIAVRGEWVPECINTLPSEEFILHLKIERLKLFNYLVKKDKTQLAFYRGWVQRLENI